MRFLPPFPFALVFPLTRVGMSGVLHLELDAAFQFSGEVKSDDITALTALEVPPMHV